MFRILLGLILAGIVLFSVIQIQRMIGKSKGCGRGCAGCGASSCCPAIKFPEKELEDEGHHE